MTPDSPLRAPSRTYGARFWVPLLLLGTAFVHLASLRAPFLFDDVPTVVQNPNIESLTPLSRALSAPEGSNVDGRPLAALSLALNYAWGERDPYGYHLVNVLLHTLATLALYGLVRHIARQAGTGDGRATALAGALALVWSVHPLQVATVVQVAYRNEAMAGLAMLLATWAALAGMRREGAMRSLLFALAVFATALGVASKEIAAVLPLVVLLLDRQYVSSSWGGAWRRHRGLYLGLAAAWPLLVWIRLGTSRGSSVGFDLEGLSSLDYLRTQAGVLLHYLQKSAWPSGLLIDYEDWPIARTWSAALPQGPVMLSLLALATWALVRRHVAGTWAWIALLILAPTSSVLPLGGAIVGEHRVYLPLACWLALAGWALHFATRTLTPERRTALLVALAIAAALPLAWRSHLRHGRFDDPVVLWAHHVEVRPNNVRAWTSYGAALRSAGLTDAARAAGERAIELRPSEYRAHVNLGNLALDRGDLAAAKQSFGEAVRLAPDQAEPHYSLGSAAAVLGDAALACEHLEAALSLNLDPRLQRPARQTLAWTLATAPVIDSTAAARALELAEELLRSSDGKRPRLWSTLAAAQAAGGNYAAARESIARSLQLCPPSHPQRGLYSAQAEAYGGGKRWTNG